MRWPSLSPAGAVVISGMFLTALIAVRFIYSSITGYILPDEAFDLSLFVIQGLGFSSYRPMLHLAFAVFFYGASSPFQMLLRGEVFCLVWAVGCVVVLRKITKALGLDRRTSSLLILSFPLFPVVALMSVFFVTETMGLFLVLVGVLFSIRYVKGGGVRNAAFSSAFFVLASLTREPYLLLVFGNLLALAWLRREWKPLLACAAVALIVMPVPIRLNPVSISQPVSVLLIEVVPNAVFAALHHPPASGSGSSSGSGSGSATTAGPPPPSIPDYIFRASNSVRLSFGLDELKAFTLGFIYGFGPLFVLLLTSSLYLLSKSRRDPLAVFILVLSLLSILSYYVTADFAVEFLPDATSQWLSNLIRLSSGAVPAIFGIAWVYRRASTRLLAVGFLLYAVVGAAALPAFASAVQSSQNLTGIPVDRLSLNYRTPYLRMSQYLDGGHPSVVITGVGFYQLEAFTAGFGDVKVVGIPPTQQALDSLIAANKGSYIYFYDSWVSVASPSSITACQCYPDFFSSIVLTRSFENRTLVTLWADGESYAELLVQ